MTYATWSPIYNDCECVIVIAVASIHVPRVRAKGWLFRYVLWLLPMCSIGTTLAFKARQQVSAAVHAKLLRLNGAAVNAISPGLVINLVSDDVRRFDNGTQSAVYHESTCVSASSRTDMCNH